MTLLACDDATAPTDLGSEAVEAIEICEIPPVALDPSVNLVQDIQYRMVEGRTLELDVAWPGNGRGNHPLVLLIHGGGWQEGSEDDLAGPLLQLASRGYAAASVEYRLAPHHPFPAAIQDLQCAVAWLAEAAADGAPYDPDRLAVVGISAGGHLASLLAVAGGRSFGGGCALPRRLLPDAVVAFSAPQDLAALSDFPVLTQATIEAFLGGADAATRARAEAASTVTYVQAGVPPFLLVHGDRDAVVPLVQAERLHERIRAVGGESTLIVLEGAGHGITPLSPAVELPSCTTLRFLDERLGPG